MESLFVALGRIVARYLDQPSRGYEPIATTDPAQLRAALRPGDVLLVEGNRRISVAIKYLTQSTWSHAALHIGDALAADPAETDPPVLVEADLLRGVRAVPVSQYEHLHTRICRPFGLNDEDRLSIVRAAISRLGQGYDLKNVIDLARYLFPTPPVPVRWRRRMIALGSGEPTRAICSTLIAQLFQAVGYPILPRVDVVPAPRPGCEDCVREIWHIRHHSLFTPRDFDVSPYFQIVKPSLQSSLAYKSFVWDRGEPDGAPPPPVG